MADAELRVLLRTVAEGQGAEQTRDALRRVQSEASNAQESLGRAGRAARDAGSGFRIGTEDILRFTGALTGVDIGLSLFATAGRAVRDAIGGAIEAQRDAERVTRATALAYRENAESFQRFAAALSAQTGFSRTAILEAALSARTLSDNYGLTIAQTQKLIAVSADLARVRGVGVAEAFERVQSAIRGEAEASEFLGLTLNATFLKQNAANGAYRQTFETLTDAQRAQIVYTELLRQSQQFQGLAADGAGELNQAMSKASVAGNNLSTSLGKLIQPEVVAFLNAVATLAERINAASVEAEKRGGLQGLRGGLQGLFANLPRLPEGLPPPLGVLAPAINTAADLARLKQGRDELEQARARALAFTDAEGLLNERAGLLTATVVQQTRTIQLLDERLQRTTTSTRQLADAMSDINQRAGTLSALLGGLGAGEGDVAARVAIQSQVALSKLDAAILARRSVATLEAELAREREATKITDPRDAAGARAAADRVRFLEQIAPLERELIEVQERQNALQREAVQLTARQAEATLRILPIRERLNDMQAEIQRARLVAADRADFTAADRSAARRRARDLMRNALPGAELAAFDAERSLVPLNRAAERNQLLQQIGAALTAFQERKLEVTINGVLDVLAGGARFDAAGAQQLADLVAGRVQSQVFAQLTEANAQAQLPPVVPQSGVRR